MYMQISDNFSTSQQISCHVVFGNLCDFWSMCDAVIHHHGREARGVDRIRRMCEVMWTGADVVRSLHRPFVGFTLPGDAVLPGVPQQLPQHYRPLHQPRRWRRSLPNPFF